MGKRNNPFADSPSEPANKKSSASKNPAVDAEEDPDVAEMLRMAAAGGGPDADARHRAVMWTISPPKSGNADWFPGDKKGAPEKAIRLLANARKKMEESRDSQSFDDVQIGVWGEKGQGAGRSHFHIVCHFDAQTRLFRYTQEVCKQWHHRFGTVRQLVGYLVVPGSGKGIDDIDLKPRLMRLTIPPKFLEQQQKAVAKARSVRSIFVHPCTTISRFQCENCTKKSQRSAKGPEVLQWMQANNVTGLEDFDQKLEAAKKTDKTFFLKALINWRGGSGAERHFSHQQKMVLFPGTNDPPRTNIEFFEPNFQVAGKPAG